MPHQLVQVVTNWRAALALTALLLCGACDSGRRKLPPEPPPPAMNEVPDPLLRGTVGAVTTMTDIVGQPVRGFGVVVGLGEQGSGDCPTFIREHLVDVMSREAETWASLEQRKRFSPDALIDSPSTAVVEVNGTVPAGAPAQTTFDLFVQAVPGTATRSLAGGLLLPCELYVADVTGNDQRLLGGTVVARAHGPVFVSPFSAADGTPADPRVGTVFSGGLSAEARSVRLLLREPSYPLARRLRDRINERFGQRPPVADAMSRGYLTVETPEQYAREPEHFLRILPHVYLDTNPAYLDARLRELSRRMVEPEADQERISLLWEALGKVALPYAQQFYTHPEAEIRFWAARAGLRLNDVAAVSVLGSLASGDDRPLALAAIAALGKSHYPQAAVHLRPLLDRTEAVVRVAAYEALVQHREFDPSVRTLRFPHAGDRLQVNVLLDVVESKGDPLIYVRTSRLPRIAVFGADVPVEVPLFYSTPGDALTLNAANRDSEITVFAKWGNQVSDPIHVPPRVVDLVGVLADVPIADESGDLRGIGMPYSEIVDTLLALADEGSLHAPIETELGLPVVRADAPLPDRPEGDRPRDFRTDVEAAQPAARAEGE